MRREATDLLNFFAVQGGLTKAELDAVVFGGIMRCRDHAAAIGVQMEQGKVEHGSRHQADIDNIATGGLQPLGERHTEGPRTEPVITAYRQALATSLTHIRAKGEADTLHIGNVEIMPHDTADIILPENLGVHEVLPCSIV